MKAAKRICKVKEGNRLFRPACEKWLLKNRSIELYITEEGRKLLKKLKLSPQERRLLKEDPLKLFKIIRKIPMYEKGRGKKRHVFALKHGGKHAGKMIECMQITNAVCEIHNNVLRGRNAPKHYKLRRLISYFTTPKYWVMEYINAPTVKEALRHPRYLASLDTSLKN
jgi:hypothetical protein